MTPSAHRLFLDEIDREIISAEESIKRLRAVREYHATKSGIPQAPTVSIASKLSDSDVVRHLIGRKNKGGDKVNQRELAFAVLSEASGPMRSRDVAEAIVARGYPKPANIGKLANGLFTLMTRNPTHFKKVGAGLWAVKSKESST